MRTKTQEPDVFSADLKLKTQTKIISIHSYRGGTGKSNIAINLAYLIALRGDRVCLVDFDLPSPGLNLIVDIKPTKTINDVIRTEHKGLFPAPLPKDILVDVKPIDCNRDKLLLAPASNNSNDISEIVTKPPALGVLYDFLDDLKNWGRFDYLIVDTHPGISRNTLLAVASADICVTVIRPDRQDYQGTVILQKLLRELKVKPEQTVILVNKAPGNVQVLRDQLTKQFKQAVVGVLPISLGMSAFGSKGIFALKYPNDPWTTELMKSIEFLT